MSQPAKNIPVKWYATADSFEAHRNKCAALGISQSQALNQAAHQWMREPHITRLPGRHDRATLVPVRARRATDSRRHRGGAPMPRMSV